MLKGNRSWLTAAAVLALAAIASLWGGEAQQPAAPASMLVRSLSVEPSRGPFGGIVGCAESDQIYVARSTAAKIVGLGTASLPELERAFDSLEKTGDRSEFFQNAGWLFFAYARIAGAATAPRLDRMMGNPKLVAHRRNLDIAMALALSLTSYVSNFAERALAPACRPQEPKDGLDRLIASLEEDDRTELESSLGSEARQALNRALELRTWNRFRRQIWRGPSKGQSGVGYRFDIKGAWSEPEETLDDTPTDYGDAPLTSDSVILETQFKNSVGKDCGKRRIQFRRVEVVPHVGRYSVDSSDIEDLLRLIGACAEH